MSEQEDIRRRYATVGSAFLGKVAQRLQSLEVEKLSAADVARWTEVAMKLEQAGQFRRATPDRREQYLEKISRDDLFTVEGAAIVDLDGYDKEDSSDER